jgi:peptide-methionine (R)-S-oxide reductase
VLIVEKNYLTQIQSMKVAQAGHLFMSLYPDVFETKTDHLLGYARTEYHCKKCGGHHGHIFEDGPNPTGKRYCNNGVCLVFKPKE